MGGLLEKENFTLNALSLLDTRSLYVSLSNLRGERQEICPKLLPLEKSSLKGMTRR